MKGAQMGTKLANTGDFVMKFCLIMIIIIDILIKV